MKVRRIEAAEASKTSVRRGDFTSEGIDHRGVQRHGRNPLCAEAFLLHRNRALGRLVLSPKSASSKKCDTYDLNFVLDSIVQSEVPSLPPASLSTA